jgi:exosortase B
VSATFQGRRVTSWLEWLPPAAGLASLYAVTFHDLAGTLWKQDDYSHGPIILAVIAWLIWRNRVALLEPARRTAFGAGVTVLLLGLLLYVVGRSFGIIIFEVGSLAPVLAGTVLAMRGPDGIRKLWFPIVFIVFLVPLPGVFVDALTGPLKQEVSAVAERLLHAANYPVARDGVILTVGQYQLLVADACSGLNSMFSLTALGVLYLHLMRRSRLHSALIIAGILPIAFAANIVRVLALVLVTFHFGDAAGQGFLHGAAGMVLILAALVLIISLDALLARVVRPAPPAGL